MIARLRLRLTASREVPAFAAVGAGAYVIDVAVFNLAHALGADPIVAKVASTLVSTLAAYVGNRLWVFRDRDDGGWRGLLLFLLLNALALLPSLGCLAAARMAGFTSRFALNVAGNVVGTGLGTAFRFLTYRRLVFLRPPAPAAAA